MIKINYEFNPVISIKDYIFKPDYNECVTLNVLEKNVDEILNKIPKVVKDIAQKEGWTITVTNQRNLEEEYKINYKILGITDSDRKQIFVYADLFSIKYSIPHEFGHIIDYYLGHISSNLEWQKLYSEYFKILSEKYSNIFTSNTAEEFFADCFLAYTIKPAIFENACYSWKCIKGVLDRIIEVLPYIEKPLEDETFHDNVH